jgi:hypothetical protein
VSYQGEERLMFRDERGEDFLVETGIKILELRIFNNEYFCCPGGYLLGKTLDVVTQ